MVLGEEIAVKREQALCCLIQHIGMWSVHQINKNMYNFSDVTTAAAGSAPAASDKLLMWLCDALEHSMGERHHSHITPILTTLQVCM